MKIKFLKDEIYETEGRNRGPRFKAGDVVDFRQDIAERWLRRGHEEAKEESDEGVGEKPADKPSPTSAKPAPRPEPVSTVMATPPSPPAGPTPAVPSPQPAPMPGKDDRVKK